MFDSGQTAQLRVTFEQSPAKSSTPESQTASVRLIVCALQQDSLAQVKPYVGTTTATPRPGFPPHASLRSADVPLSARNFHSQRQLAAHKHGGAGTAFSPPGTALTMLFSIRTGTGKPSSGVSLWVCHRHHATCSNASWYDIRFAVYNCCPRIFPAVMPHLAPSGSCALVCPSFRMKCHLLATLKRNSKLQMNAEEAEIQEEKKFSLISMYRFCLKRKMTKYRHIHSK